MSPKPKRPLDIYVRVSRVGGREGESYISPAVQEERCRALAAARGFQVGEVFTDEDRSGGKMSRPAFEKALARIESGISGGIIVARIDRFARTLLGGLQTLEEIREAGGVVATAEGDFDTSTNTGELVQNMMLTLAQFELRRITEGWATANAKAIARGAHIGPTPAGYARGEGGRLEPNGYAAAVREAFALAAGGGSLAQVARALSAAGVPTNRGGQVWTTRAVWSLLQNRTYLGEVRWGAEVKAGAHEGIVDERTFYRASRQGEPVARNRSARLLNGILRCGSCGKLLTWDASRRRSRKTGEMIEYGAYRCKAEECAAPAMISARKSEGVIEAAALEYLGGITYHREQVDDAEAGDALAELHDAEAYAEELSTEVASGTKIPVSALAAAQKAVEAAREALSEVEIGTRVEVLTPQETRERYASMTTEERNAVLRALIERVVISRGQDEADLRFREVPREWRAPVSIVTEVLELH